MELSWSRHGVAVRTAWYNALVKRRLFTILSAISLGLCLATAGMWVRSYVQPVWRVAGLMDPWECDAWHGDIRFDWPHMALYDNGKTPRNAWSFIGLRYARLMTRFDIGDDAGLRSVYGQWRAQLTIPVRFPFGLAAILPALWLWRWRRDRRLRSDGMPHCAKCDYNLTGNVSGICPECGTPIPADLVRRPLT